MSADHLAIATSFTQFYYAAFDRNRAELLPLYRDMSMLTFEGQQHQGAKAIVEKLQALPFTKVQHKVSTVDAQPSNPNLGSIMVYVTGQLLVDEESNPQLFGQVFQLIPDGQSWFVFNDVFRLIYG